MIKIIKQEIKISHELKSKVELACRLNNTKPIFTNGSLLKLEPHRAIINNKTYIYYNCEFCHLNLREDYVEEYMIKAIYEFLEFEQMCNSFFLPILADKKDKNTDLNLDKEIEGYIKQKELKKHT